MHVYVGLRGGRSVELGDRKLFAAFLESNERRNI